MRSIICLSFTGFSGGWMFTTEAFVNLARMHRQLLDFGSLGIDLQGDGVVRLDARGTPARVTKQV